MHSRRNNPIRQALIVIVTTGMCIVALAFGFQVKSPAPEKGPAAAADSQDVQRIALPNDRREVPPQMHPLLDYMSVMDPTIMTHPTDINPRLDNLHVGLYARSAEFLRQRQDLPPARSTLDSVPPPPLPPRPVAKAVESPLNAFAAARQRARPDEESVTTAASLPKPEARAYWLDENGRELEFFPRLAANALDDINRIADSPTILEVLPPESLRENDETLPKGTDLPRIRILRSSGNAALDQVAYRHLQRFVTRQLAAVRNPQRPIWLTAPRTITVLWEYVPGISYRSNWQDKLETDETLEPPWYDLHQH